MLDHMNTACVDVGFADQPLPTVFGVHDHRVKARELRLANAANGYRRPVQVLEGNYEVMAGVCPWWDSLKARTAAR